MKKYNSKFAFSLIELSIVILIIGILIIGISKGSRIIRSSKLRSAQTLTAGSPVASMDGLLLWYESTLDKSFNSGEAVDTAIGATGTISTWNDINPQTTTPKNATQGTAANKPRYRLNAINGLPTLNFDGVGNPNGDNLFYDGTGLVGTNYTIFIVEQRIGTSGWLMASTTSTTTNQNLALGYDGNNINAYFNQYSNDYKTTIPAYTSPMTRIHAYRFNSVLGKNYYINGAQATLVIHGAAVGTQGLTGYPNATIGAGGGFTPPYQGDIGEIIMFTRYLSDTERSNVEKYLKAKWGIK